MRQTSMWSAVWLFLCLGTVGWGCGKKVERRCLTNESCLTETPTVCFNGRCLPKVCEPGSHRTCYTAAQETRDMGVCRKGVQLCEHNGSAWSVCVGEVRPTPEVCDQRDNNCNGSVDEGLSCSCEPGTSRPCLAEHNGTEPAPNTSCRSGIQYCLANKIWGACVNQITTDMRFRLGYADPAFRAQTMEEMKSCLDMDRNCDGKLDLDRTCTCQAGDSRACYLGPPGTAGVGACRKGIQRCVQSSEQAWRWGFCEQQTLPQVEELMGCNGVDDDCDGKVDNQAGTDVPLWKVCSGLSRSCAISLCRNRSWSLCEQVELCGNGLDDDCDGKVDETVDTDPKGCVRE